VDEYVQIRAMNPSPSTFYTELWVGGDEECVKGRDGRDEVKIGSQQNRKVNATDTSELLRDGNLQDDS